ncbi:hypothetical protein [Embleya scabrispora]|uniref:hypothetical protein n=1 Tax=Embleya scabrispora TaxID=159449 RepID=UPI00039F0971|nr:hypothetical protein [Embleya scabrispora]MYS79326.1 hypothetical protein [Streptomyces sp. SID5474]
MFTIDTTGAGDRTSIRIARWGVRHFGKLFRDPYRGTVGRLREVEGFLAVLRTREGLEVACSVRHLVDAITGEPAAAVTAGTVSTSRSRSG